MTVSSKHGFDMGKADLLMNEASKRGSKQFHIYYVLPADVYDSFTCPQCSFDGAVRCLKLKISDY